jgi:ATP-dependent DNA ligase
MLTPPIDHMLAKPLGGADLSSLRDVSFEPKWDGFRALVFRDGDSVVLQGRGRSKTEGMVDLAYAFPELVSAMRAQLPRSVVIDGEIVVAMKGKLDFSLLQQRLRPRSEAGSGSIDRLAAELPALFLAFDLLADHQDHMHEPLHERRLRLEALAADWTPPLILTPATTSTTLAARWFTDFEAAGVDGLIVKPRNDPYLPGKRAQGKIKHERTVDAVVAGLRLQNDNAIASMLLGLYDANGVLQFVGATSAFTAARRRELRDELRLYETDGPHPWLEPVEGQRVPGAVNRWKKGSEAWIPLRPERVVEVIIDQMEADRFRHVAAFSRWRPDRDAASSTYEQVSSAPPATIADLLEF